MTDPIPEPEPMAEGDASPPSMPRWVKVSAIVAVVVVLALIAIMALVGGEHGPGLHTGADAPAVVASVGPLVAVSS